MLFADVALAARIERAECSLLSDCADAVARRGEDPSVLSLEFAGAVATYTGANSPLNKLAGLGFGEVVDQEDLGRVERAFAERGAPVRAEVSSLADPSLFVSLTRRGYSLQNFENVLGRTITGTDEPGPGVAIDVSVGEENTLEAWLDVLSTGFANPDTQGVPSLESFSRESLRQVIGDVASSAGFHRYLAHQKGVLVGGAGLRVCDGIAQLCGAATLPDHRRRGVHSALLARRMMDAAGHGCNLAVVTTQPGSKSQENIQQQGFSLLYTRAIMVRPAPDG